SAGQHPAGHAYARILARIPEVVLSAPQWRRERPNPGDPGPSPHVEGRSRAQADAGGHAGGDELRAAGARMLRAHRGRWPRVDTTVFIDDSAQVIGDVEIGPDSSVWMCAVVRGDVNSIRVGSRTNIQDGAVVHVMTGTYPTRIGDDVTVGHAAVIHGATI